MYRIHYKELAEVVVEARKSHSLQFARWVSRKAGDADLRTGGQTVEKMEVPTLRESQPVLPSSTFWFYSGPKLIRCRPPTLG